MVLKYAFEKNTLVFLDYCQKEQKITFHSENFKSAKITFCLIFSHHGLKICEILVNF
jgi:hypothetical protein